MQSAPVPALTPELEERAVAFIRVRDPIRINELAAHLISQGIPEINRTAYKMAMTLINRLTRQQKIEKVGYGRWKWNF